HAGTPAQPGDRPPRAPAYAERLGGRGGARADRGHGKLPGGGRQHQGAAGPAALHERNDGPDARRVTQSRLMNSRSTYQNISAIDANSARDAATYLSSG